MTAEENLSEFEKKQTAKENGTRGERNGGVNESWGDGCLELGRKRPHHHHLCSRKTVIGTVVTYRLATSKGRIARTVADAKNLTDAMLSINKITSLSTFTLSTTVITRKEGNYNNFHLAKEFRRPGGFLTAT